jgi:hypothetical protein
MSNKTATDQFVYVPTPAQPVQTIQKTAKVWKFLQAVSVIGFVFGLVLTLSTITDPDQTPGDGLALITLSGVMYVVVRFLGWWNHG